MKKSSENGISEQTVKVKFRIFVVCRKYIIYKGGLKIYGHVCHLEGF